MTSLYAVVPAAGIGARMLAGKPKQYLSIAGTTILEQTLKRLLDFEKFTKVILVVSNDDEYLSELSIKHHPKIEVCNGGAERYHSVLNGLKHLQNMGVADDSLVMVHDVARPCINQTDLENLYRAANDHGALLGLQVRDTMKRTDEFGCVIKTVDRNNLWHALTPQMAPLLVLLNAIEQSLKDGINITDEASALEHIGLTPKIIAGDPSNIKVTRPDDLALAEAFLKQEKEQERYDV